MGITHKPAGRYSVCSSRCCGAGRPARSHCFIRRRNESRTRYIVWLYSFFWLLLFYPPPHHLNLALNLPCPFLNFPFTNFSSFELPAVKKEKYER